MLSKYDNRDFKKSGTIDKLYLSKLTNPSSINNCLHVVLFPNKHKRNANDITNC